ncbi:sec-independent protein translocase protein TATA, chloroplastic [Iris pallida]|uniref:Sec-independent protein translocase protein TATA, chloroplastic n=1 Tax=Iris pallida TaxID=29817 RepID=A0AAX6DYP4_IRIPA|nr:sec-independent protein translocase protein TATA, chloroplastic [Iris pallida]KAJ6847169.1 sec-independent protein translocase protein TATA, chloroplastic [Iris pallida]
MEMFCCSHRPLMAYSSHLPAKITPLPLSSSSSAFFATAGKRTSLVSAARTRRRRTGPTRCLFGLGVPELAVIAGVAALVFGPKQLPEIGRNIGKTVKSFQQAAKEFETELKKEPEDTSDQLPPPTESPNKVGNEDEKKLEASGSKESG